MPPRTRKMTRTEVRTRAQHAHAFLTAADLVVDLGHDAGIDDLGNTIGSLAVLAGIAAGDAICGAVLGERAAGPDHGDAVAMLRRTEPGRRLAQHLARLIDSKTETQYSPLLAHRSTRRGPAQGRTATRRRHGRRLPHTQLTRSHPFHDLVVT